LYDEDTLCSKFQEWFSAGYQIATHAIGDRGNRIVLNCYEKVANASGGIDLIKKKRLRIEHAQIVHPDDIQRFGKLGVIPSMQPTHATSDMSFAEVRLGHERAKTEGYQWKAMLDARDPALPLGSDFPTVGKVPPFYGIYAAVTRKDQAGNPAQGWFPEQKLSLEQALKGYTTDAAFSSFREMFIGSISPGKFADFIIIDRDIMKSDPAELWKTKVLCTFFDGREIWKSNEFAWKLKEDKEDLNPWSKWGGGGDAAGSSFAGGFDWKNIKDKWASSGPSTSIE
jgi:predicted amidohydrolase YtcJ